MPRGVRMIAGREFLLAGRTDSKERATADAKALRQEWERVRVIKLRDWDFMLYAHGRRYITIHLATGFKTKVRLAAVDRRNLPAEISDLTWYSSDTAVATVEPTKDRQEAYIVAQAPGFAMVHVTADVPAGSGLTEIPAEFRVMVQERIQKNAL